MGFFQDLRDARRSLWRRPIASLVAVATLALGIGAGTAVFSAVRWTLLEPLGFREPQRLVLIEERDKNGAPSNLGYATYLDWRARSRSFEDVAVWGTWSPTLVGDPESEKVEGLRVSEGFFGVLGVRPQLGRTFLSSEHTTGNHRVVLLSHELWKRRYSADPAIVGAKILIGETPHLVVGVLPPDFEPIFSGNAGKPERIFRPLGYNTSQDWACRTCRHLSAIGRLRGVASIESARAEMNALTGALFREHPTEYPGPGAFVTPLFDSLIGDARPLLTSLLAAVGFVVAIGCANVASVLLGFAVARRREVAVRLSLGASRGSIARLFLSEGLLLAAAGGLAGLLAAQWILDGLIAIAPAQIPRLTHARVDLPVVLFGALLAACCGVAAGAVPALRTSRTNPEVVLREASGGSGGPARRRLGNLLIAFDAALALVLLFGAGLVIRSTDRLLSVQPGFDPGGVLTADLHATYPEDEPTWHFFEAVLERARQLPGVRAAGAVSQLPLSGDYDQYGVEIEGRPLANPELAPQADRYGIFPGYLEAMSIPVRRGRALTEADRAGAPPVVLVNDLFARREFPGEDPIGRRVRLGGPEGEWRTIVGIVGNVRHLSLGDPLSGQVYVPSRQWTFADSGMAVVLRTDGDPSALAGPLRAAVRSVDPAPAVSRVEPLEQIVARSTASRRFAAVLLTAFAGLAVLLAAVGIFGVVSSFIARQTREIGIRVALGAGRGRLLGWVFGGLLRPAAVGIAAGSAAALAFGRLLSSQLYEVSPRDPVVLGAVAITVVALAAAAGAVPARRVARVDPMVALRNE